jgi:superfamily II DNA or RNA helicase
VATAWDGAPFAPRKWQAESLPVILKCVMGGQRPVVSAFMGSGKSVQIAELCYLALEKTVARGQAVVVAAPRRQLVKQLAATIAARCGPGNVGRYYSDAKQPRRPIVVTCFDSLPSLAEDLVKQGRRVSLFVADECHGTERDQVLGPWEMMDPASAVGFTATAYRSNEKESLSLWSSICYRYSFADARRDGVVVPWRVVNWDGQGCESHEVNEVCLQLLRKSEAQGLSMFPMLASSSNIADAEEFATFLTEQGYPAEAAHSKRSEAENGAAIGRLQGGEIKVLVHVSKYAEGTDFPWLRGLLLRRDVGSRVRFVQEVGRPLRADPGAEPAKTYAVILDPFDLMGTIGLDHEEQIGEILAEPEEVREAKEREAAEARVKHAVAVGDVQQWTRQVLALMEAGGLVEIDPKTRADDAQWRNEAPTTAQMTALQGVRWATRYLPRHARAPSRKLIDKADRLPRGAVSDLISMLIGLSRATRETRDAAKAHQRETGSWAGGPKWEWPETLEVPVCPGPPPVTPEDMERGAAK